MDRHRNGSTAVGEDVMATVNAVQLPPVCPEFCDDVFASHIYDYRLKLIYLLSTKNGRIDHVPFTMKRRSERKAVPLNAPVLRAVVEMPLAVAQVGTASVPTYARRANSSRQRTSPACCKLFLTHVPLSDFEE